MKLLIPLLICSIFCLTFSADAQEYSYTHYGISDGLAGSTVYCAVQDKEGFIWIGTETGLSRFDGTHFVSFTTADGLPDMEVLQMFCDSRGRVWMSPFHPSVCYYFKGKMHNQQNDSLLSHFHSSTFIECYAENGVGDILMQEQKSLHLVTSEGKIIDYYRINGRPVDTFYTIAPGPGNSFMVMEGDSLYKLQDGRFTPLLHTPHVTLTSLTAAANRWLLAWEYSQAGTCIRNIRTGKTTYRSYNWDLFTHNTYTLVGDSLVYENETTGVTEYNLLTGAERKYLPGVQVNRTYSDDEGNLWFSTKGQGVFRLNSNQINNVTLTDHDKKPCAVYFIGKSGHELLIGADHEMVFSYPLEGGPVKAYQIYHSAKGYYTFVARTPAGDFLCGTYDRIALDHPGRPHYWFYAGLQVKEAVWKNAGDLIIGNARGVFLFNLNSRKVIDTLWRQRCTALYLQRDTLYIGTLNGLYQLYDNNKSKYLGEKIPFLRKRISAIAKSKDGTLAVGSYDAGVVALRHGWPAYYLTSQQGLTSNICRTLTTHDNDLWVGTDKGLNRVSLSGPGYAVTRYTAKDGLISDMINAVYIDSQTVYAGTPDGLSHFNFTRTSLTAGCRLVLLGITSSGKDRLSSTARLVLRHTDNNIRFDFAGICYKSAGNITYHYRLSGLDSSWKTTKETFLDYPTLPSGDYELQIYAVNKFGVSSRTKNIPFTVETPFWKTTWFEFFILASVMALTWLFVSLRIKHNRRHQEEEELLNKRMKEMEHTALQAQMNPHFIFNCLNSIQQYIFDQDILAANKYITGFAKLIRATLHNSTKDLIPLEDELEYLSTYLSLEKLRFKEKMNFSIDVAHELPVNRGYFVPPMIIQPYVENCMRHGLRHRKSAGGYIRIKLQEDERKLVVVVEDNGIGREKAASYKTREHIEYQSKGMSLTADRIRLINSIHEEHIEVEIMDLKNGQGEAAGTRVVIKFPKFESTY